MGFRTITEPTSEPLTIAECRSHLHWDLDEDLASESAVEEAEDALILDKLGAARRYAENVTGLSLAVRTVEASFDRFPCARFVELPGGPVRSIDSIEYVDENGAAQPLDPASYSLDPFRCDPLTSSDPARLLLGYGLSWPTMRCQPNALTVRYVIGYGTIPDSPPDDWPLPKDIRAALLLTMAHLLENKEDSAPIALESIPTNALSLLQLNRVALGV